ncbi:MAG TPA: hypothetical protein VGF67_09415 [Ktedonobacteraceae bacterium]
MVNTRPEEPGEADRGERDEKSWPWRTRRRERIKQRSSSCKVPMVTLHTTTLAPGEHTPVSNAPAGSQEESDRPAKGLEPACLSAVSLLIHFPGSTISALSRALLALACHPATFVSRPSYYSR